MNTNQILTKLESLDRILDVMLEEAATEVLAWERSGLLKPDGVIRKLAAEYVDFPTSPIGFVKDRVLFKCMERVAKNAIQTT